MGNLEPIQGEPVIFDWKWYFMAPGLIIWLVLIAVLVLPKSNRNINALAIFFPIAVLNLLWPVFVKIVSMPSSAYDPYTTMFQSMVIGIAVLWLKADFIGKFGGFVRFLLSLLTVLLTATVGALSYSTSFSEEMIVMSFLFVFMTLALLLALIISRGLSGRKYRPIRFMLWLALWILILGVFSIICFYMTLIVILSNAGLSIILQQLLMITIVGLVIGVFLYAMILPYMIMGFINPFFRERLMTCLRLQPVHAAAEAGNINEQTDNITDSEQST